MTSNTDNKIEINFDSLTEAINELNTSIIYTICNEYSLDKEDVMSKFSNLNYSHISNKNMKKKKEKKPREYPVPWCPNYVDNKKCNAIVFNRGLFTQCQRIVKNNSQIFCNICNAHPENSYQKYGTINERLDHGIYDYKAPNGIEPSPYMNYIPTNVDVSEVKENLKTRGYSEIPQEHFDKPRTNSKTSRNKKPGLYIEPINNSPINERDYSPLDIPQSKSTPLHEQTLIQSYVEPPPPEPEPEPETEIIISPVKSGNKKKSTSTKK